MERGRGLPHESTGPLHHPVMTVKAVHFSDDWKSVTWRYPVWLDFGKDRDEGWCQIFTPQVTKLLENLDANMRFWAHTYIDPGDPCEIATVRTNTQTGESTYQISEEPEARGTEAIPSSPPEGDGNQVMAPQANQESPLDSVGFNISYTINLNLPETTNPDVFNAIFREGLSRCPRFHWHRAPRQGETPVS
ncbi:MAG: hypothetical protein IID16_09165, partial [Candidatus Marinimicrobia bacterium]|nr:hypothetical protein [Candidatus Neomarinimicrobiota bacterium]